MRATSIGLGVGLFLFAMSLMGCGGKQPSVQLPPAAEEILESLHFGRAELDSVQVEAKGIVKNGNRRARFHASLLARQPDLFFVEAGGFGFPAVQLSRRKGHLAFFVPSEQNLFEGKDEVGLRQVLGIRFPVKDFVPLVLGRLPANFGRVLSMKRKGERWEVTAKREGRKRVYQIDAKSGWLHSIRELDPASFQITFGKPISTKAGLFPSSIQIASARNSFFLQFKDVLVNPQIPDDHFRLDVPDSISSRPIENVRFLVR